MIPPSSGSRSMYQGGLPRHGMSPVPPDPGRYSRRVQRWIHQDLALRRAVIMVWRTVRAGDDTKTTKSSLGKGVNLHTVSTPSATVLHRPSLGLRLLQDWIPALGTYLAHRHREGKIMAEHPNVTRITDAYAA